MRLWGKGLNLKRESPRDVDLQIIIVCNFWPIGASVVILAAYGRGARCPACRGAFFLDSVSWMLLGSVIFVTPGRRRGAGRRGRATGRAPESSGICGPAHRAQCASVLGANEGWIQSNRVGIAGYATSQQTAENH